MAWPEKTRSSTCHSFPRCSPAPPDTPSSVIYFILWVAVMVWIYNIAKRKGRHPVGWVILAFFFFFLALILILILPSKRTTQRASH